MVREVRDQTNSILTKCGELVEEVVQVKVAGGGQGNVTPNEFDLEPEEDLEEEPAAPKEVVESAGSVTN